MPIVFKIYVDELLVYTAYTCVPVVFKIYVQLLVYTVYTCVPVVFKIYVELAGGSECLGNGLSILLLVCRVWGREFTNNIFFTI